MTEIKDPAAPPVPSSVTEHQPARRTGQLVATVRRSALGRRAGRTALVATRPVRLRGERPAIAVRDELPLLLNRRGLLGRGFEVGVKQGHYSETLLRLWKGRELVSVDPWFAQDEDVYRDLDNVEQGEHDRFYAETVERLSPFGGRSAIWRTTGEEAATRVPDRSLDFVYLDARHDHVSVREDLGHWWPKLRPGGVFAGHDYVDGLFAEGEFGVRSAVDGFFADKGIEVCSTFADPWISWYVLVPAGD